MDKFIVWLHELLERYNWAVWTVWFLLAFIFIALRESPTC